MWVKGIFFAKNSHISAQNQRSLSEVEGRTTGLLVKTEATLLLHYLRKISFIARFVQNVYVPILVVFGALKLGTRLVDSKDRISNEFFGWKFYFNFNCHSLHHHSNQSFQSLMKIFCVQFL